MRHCESCDVAGPDFYGPWFTSYEMLAAHRAWHSFAREIVKVFLEPVVDKINNLFWRNK